MLGFTGINTPSSEMGVPSPNSTKDRLLKLMAEKDKLESKISGYGDVLSANDNVGMNGPLIDLEGFPRNDIDIYAVRQARQQIISLQNDHKALMKQIEELMHKLHSDVKEVEQISNEVAHMKFNGPSSSSNNLNDIETEQLKAFLKVDLVFAGSPAEEAGLCVEDRILQFGTINSNNFNNKIEEIGSLVKHMQNQRVPIKLQRGEQTLDIILIPKTWKGRGLLGCNIVLINLDNN